MTVCKERPKRTSNEFREPNLGIVKVLTLNINGAPSLSLSEIINQFLFSGIELALPKIPEHSDDVLEIHSKMSLN